MVFFISLLLLSLRLFSFPLKNWDEAWYAEIIKNMTNGAGFMVPFWNGQYYFDKPTLYFILSQPITRLFGLGEWQVRVVSIVAGALSVYLIFALARYLFSKRIGLLASGIFLSTLMVYRRFSEGNLDSLLLLFILLSQYLVLVYHGKHKNTLIAVSLFLTTIIKSWLFVGIPVLTSFIYLFLSKESKLIKDLALACFYVGLAYIFWIVIGTANYGHDFYRWYLFKPAGYNYENPHLIFNSHLFFSLFANFAIWLFAIVVPKTKPKSSSSGSKYLISTALVSGLYFASLLFSADQFDWYLLPIYPVIAIFIASKIYNLRSTILIFLIAFQFLFTWTQIKIDPDNSAAYARLGQEAKKYAKPGDLIILDSPSFSTFLYYSDLGQMYSLKSSGGKPWEWWIITPERAKELSKNSSKPAWTVTLDQ